MKKLIFSRKQLCIPYSIFLVLFVIFPLLVVVYYALTNGEGNFSMGNLAGFFSNGRTLGTLLYSIWIAFLTTIFCLLLAYPTAYLLARGGLKKSQVLLLLFVIPMWINFTLRITAVKEILTFLEGNLAFYPLFNTILCMVYDFLPFMILPIYTTLSKLNNGYVEAAADLGADSRQVFFRVILPLSMPGVVSGITMVFLPAMTNYVILDMIYNSTYIMGSLIGSYFSSYDWNNGSVVSIVLLGMILLLTWFTDRFSTAEDIDNRGGALL